ncbi:hypothetical protein Tco_0717860, partial [Tanacetum coccineum]
TSELGPVLSRLLLPEFLEMVVGNCRFVVEKDFSIFVLPNFFDLTITDPYAFPKPWKVLSPQLENLTASVKTSLKDPLLLRFSTVVQRQL